MILINFSHPLTPLQLDEIQKMAGVSIQQTIEVFATVDLERPLAEQVVELANAVGLSEEQWASEAILISLPSYAPVAACLLAELHGRLGYFPSIVRLRPIVASKTRQYELAEIVNLQFMRANARDRRQ